MSKLFKLKKWLSLSNAAKHLSTIFDEEVSEADILRLSLDRQLRLSVHLVNGASARIWVEVQHSEVKWRQVIGLEGEPVNLPDRPVLTGDDGVMYQRLDGMTELAPDVWDVPMIGGEHYSVENYFQTLAGGPRCEMVDLEGVFLTAYGPCKHLFQLVGWPGKVKGGEIEDAYPLVDLPDDAVFVLRTTSLREFEDRISSECGDENVRETPNPQPDYSHISENLMLLNQAAREFWSTADRDDPTTHPSKADVAAWLIEKGMRDTKADHAASIIRPTWAHNGRKPQK